MTENRPGESGLELTADPTGERRSEQLNFRFAFWLVAITIGLGQLASYILLKVYNDDFTDPMYTFNHMLMGLVFYLAPLGIIIYRTELTGTGLGELMNLDWSYTQPHRKFFLKSLGAVVLAASFMKWLFPYVEMNLGHNRWEIGAFQFFMIVMMAPICEEIIFRAYLYSAMMSRFRRARERMAVNAMLFAAAHVFFGAFILGAGVPEYIFVLGFLLAFLYEKTRSLLACILVHAANNLVVFLINWYLYSS